MNVSPLRFLHTACIAAATLLLVSTANAVDRITFLSSSDKVTIVDGPNTINLGQMNSSIVGPTTASVSNPNPLPFSGTSASSFSPTGMVGSTTSFATPAVASLSVNSVLRSTSEVRFTTNEDLLLLATFGANSSGGSGLVNDMVVFSYNTPNFVVQTLIDETTSQVLLRLFQSSWGAPELIDGISPGPTVFTPFVDTILQAGHTYRHVLELESHQSYATPSNPGLTFPAGNFNVGGMGSISLTPIPEPSTLVLGTFAGLGLVAMSLRRRRAK